ncbi:MAG: hypothetical protein AABX07_02330 [Nanoarchaeota archaeon]
MRIAFILLIFLFFGAFFIVSNENLYLKKHDDFSKFYSLYYNWISNIFSNAKSISGYIVKFDWLPGSNQALVPKS